MFERAAYSTLMDWKQNNRNKALLIDGARQIGKTYLIEHFAQNEYRNWIKVDFLTDSSAARTLAAAQSTQQVIEALSLITGKRISSGTLVFFDEVQEAQNIVTLSKYLVQDGRFDVILSGSMLDVELKHVKSFPVGYLRIETMYPLSFEEFCRALNVPDSVLAMVDECYTKKTPLESAVHDRLIRLFRLYLVVGGMPEAVQTYISSSNDLGAVREKQQELLRLYREDIAKYAPERALQIKTIFDAIPSQLDKESKRFQIKSIDGTPRYERYANDFAWLVGAKAALKTTNITDPRPMLERSEEKGRFKLYQSDVGMLMARYRSNVALAALAGEKRVNFGAVYENAVAQELAAANVPLHYFHSSRVGEVDFIAETDAGDVVPVEVKSGKDYKRHVALNNLMKSREHAIEYAYVLSEGNVSAEKREGGTVHYLPLYMLPAIARDFHGSNLKGEVFAPPTW